MQGLQPRPSSIARSVVRCARTSALPRCTVLGIRSAKAILYHEICGALCKAFLQVLASSFPCPAWQRKSVWRGHVCADPRAIHSKRHPHPWVVTGEETVCPKVNGRTPTRFLNTHYFFLNLHLLCSLPPSKICLTETGFNTVFCDSPNSWNCLIVIIDMI